MKGLDQCFKHKRAFMYHCEDHTELFCEICAFPRHRRCDNIHEIANIAKNVKEDERKKIRASIITASEVIMKCQEDQLNNISRVEEIVKEIDFYKEDLFTKIEKAKAQIVSEITNHNTYENERLNTRRNAAEILKKDLDTLLAMSDSVRENGTETEIFILNHILKSTQDKASQTLNTLLKNDYTVKTGIKSKKRPVSLELLKTIEIVKTGDDKKQPFVTGLDFLPDGRIVAVDGYNLKCFILSDTLKRFDAFYKCKTYPNDVSSYSDNNIAVTVNDRTICLLTVGTDHKITLMKTLTISTNCFSICHLNDSTFVVNTHGDPRPARMIGVDGNESDFDNVKFPGRSYEIDESKCTYIPYGDTLVLTDRHDHTVYMFNTVTGKNTKIKDRSIREPRDACVGPDDSVFVCSEKTNSVIQISPDGDILASCNVDMTFPLAVTVSRDGSRMADNAPAHRARYTELELDVLGIGRLEPYSPDLAPLDFALFPAVKAQLRGIRFDDLESLRCHVQTIMS
ncbi:uncharacterized protein LOC128219492 [Mya arenaria]|uniref:uncharacterized protein LOC128219492 n=1 Tax=Mya arenaria TaxID=6604 RepID=UPI0022E544FC|nr:uncharacterized protein LOC128219492 [Mya arenaria]